MANDSTPPGWPKSRSMLFRDRRKLWVRAGGKCSICRVSVIEAGPVEAHIKAFSPGGPRYDPTMPPRSVNAYPNRILVCSICSHRIDIAEPASWSVERLVKVKEEHELRITQDPSRAQKLQALLRGSIARIVAGWIAAGLAPDEAEVLADDTVGLLKVSPPAAGALAVWCGEIGTGKSLGLERLFQDEIRSAANDNQSPVPVYVDARKIERDLESWCLHQSETIGNPQILGARVFIDHGDELGAGRVEGLLNEARTLVRAWPETQVIMTSRPFPQILEAPETVRIESLTDEASRSLVARIAGRDVSIGEAHSWPEPVRHAIRRPFFAILLGGMIKNSGGEPIRTTGQLISRLVQRGLGRAAVEEAGANQLLRRLAILSTNSTSSVNVRELGPAAQVLPLVQTGFLVEEDGELEFALPILGIWFSAQAIVSGDQPIDELCKSQRTLDRWRDAIEVALALVGHSRANEIVERLVAADAVFAVGLVVEATKYGSWDEGYPLTGSLEAAQEIRSRTLKWTDSFGPVVSLMRLFKGGTPALGAGTDGRQLLTAWTSDFSRGDSFALTEDDRPFVDHSGKWLRARAGTAPDHPIWAWRWSLDDFTGAMKSIVERRELPLTTSLLREMLWRAATRLMRLPPSAESVELSDFLRELGPNAHNTTYATSGGRYEGELLLEAAGSLAAEGYHEISPPWPGPDNPPDRWIWSGYSQARMVDRTTRIYTAAMEALDVWYATIFRNVAPRLRKGALFPVHLKVHIDPKRGPGDVPTADRWWEPLAYGDGSSRLTVTLEPVPLSGGDFDWARLSEVYRRARPDAEGWLTPSMSSGVLQIFQSNSATELAYEWLAQDLNEAALMDAMFSRRI